MSYTKIDNENAWKEIITPFYEWTQYLTLKRNTSPKPIEDETLIQQDRPFKFIFVHDIKAVIKTFHNDSLSIPIVDNILDLSLSTVQSLMQQCSDMPPANMKNAKKYHTHFNHILKKLQRLNILIIDNNKLVPGPRARCLATYEY